MALECSLGGLASLDSTDPQTLQLLVQACTDTLLDPVLWSWVLGITLVCALVGAAIGLTRGRWLAGLLWGAALGPIGWLIVLLSRSGLTECPECGQLNVPRAKACRHCGVNLHAVAMRSERSRLKHVDRKRGW